jgi:putative oxidoreductase
MQAIHMLANQVFSRINLAGGYVGMLPLRLLLAWEFGEAGLKKLRGENWFGEIRDEFPFPFNVVSADASWFLATWGELLGAAALAIGLGTRVMGTSLFVLTVVAWAAVHAGNGYNVCDNGWKLPLIYLAILIPLILSGPGRVSVDHLLFKRYFSAGSAR